MALKLFLHKFTACFDSCIALEWTAHWVSGGLTEAWTPFFSIQSLVIFLSRLIGWSYSLNFRQSMRNRNAKASFYNKVTSIQFGGLAAWKVKIGMLFLYHLLVLCADRLNNKWSKWRLLPAKEDNPSKCKQTHSTIRHDTITHWQSKHARTHTSPEWSD